MEYVGIGILIAIGIYIAPFVLTGLAVTVIAIASIFTPNKKD